MHAELKSKALASQYTVIQITVTDRAGRHAVMPIRKGQKVMRTEGLGMGLAVGMACLRRRLREFWNSLRRIRIP